MFGISAKVFFDGKSAQGFLNDIQKRVDISTAIALTKTAKAIEAEIKDEMGRVFDRPTPFTLNSLYVKTATRSSLQAEVKVKDKSFKGVPAVVWLAPQIYGGPRVEKRSEQRLRRSGVLYPDEFAVPGSAAKLDGYGNMSRGQLQAILADMGSHWDHSQNSTPQSRNKRASRRAVARRGVYFSPRSGSHLPRGVYERTGFSRGSSIRPVLIFVRGAPRYSKRLRFFEIGERVTAARYPREWDAAMAEGLRIAEAKARTARLAA